MLMMVNAYVRDLVVRFHHDEEGLALTEYLLLLGLLTAAVIAAVTLFGTNLNLVWEGWAAWMGGLSRGPTS